MSVSRDFGDRRATTVYVEARLAELAGPHRRIAPHLELCIHGDGGVLVEDGVLGPYLAVTRREPLLLDGDALRLGRLVGFLRAGGHAPGGLRPRDRQGARGRKCRIDL